MYHPNNQRQMHLLQFNMQASKHRPWKNIARDTKCIREHEKVQNHSLASMSTTEIVIIYKTKNVSPLLGKEGPSLNTYLVETVSCPPETPTLRKSLSRQKMSSHYWKKKGPSLGTYWVKTVSCPLKGPPPPKKD